MTPTGTVRMTIPQLVEQKGWNTQQFAEAAHLTYNQALAYRRGVTTRIDLPVLARIAEALGVEPGALFEMQAGDRQ